MKLCLLSLNTFRCTDFLCYLSGIEPARDGVAYTTNSLGIPIVKLKY